MTNTRYSSSREIRQKSDSINRNLAMGRSFHNNGHLKLAEDCYRKVLALEPQNVDALHMLGVVALQCKAFEDAIRLIRRAARKAPSDPTIFVNLGSAYHKANRHREAHDALNTAIKLKPDFAEAHFNLGRLLLEEKNLNGAIKAFQRSLALAPGDPAAHLSMGNTYKLMGEFDAAIEAFGEAIRLSPNMTEAYGNLAAMFMDKGQYDEAITIINSGLAIDPQSPELRIKRSINAFRVGDLKTGWENWESRFFTREERAARFPTPPPYWAGEPLCGKTILLWTEQGLGDEIIFSSIVPDVVAHAEHCILECSSRMVPVFERAFPKTTVVKYQGQGVRTTPSSDVDIQISIASLGKYFRPSFESFPNHQGYLKADPVKTAAMRARYQALAPDNLVVGISWRSKNDRVGVSKTADLVTWGEVFVVPGVTFVNLQYGDCVAELAEVRHTLGVDIFHDPGIDSMKSMDDFFAQVAAMDKVITTSNTTAHVAGSLNVPTYLLLNQGEALLWYWFNNRADSPWYPSMRIFRPPNQQRANKELWWSDGVRRIGQDLLLVARKYVNGV